MIEIILIIGLCMYAFNMYLNIQHLKNNKESTESSKIHSEKIYKLHKSAIEKEE